MHYRTQCIGVYTHMQSTSVQCVASLISLSMYLITCLLQPSTSCTGVCLAITMLQYYICLGIVLTVVLVLGLGLGFGIILYFVIGT